MVMCIYRGNYIALGFAERPGNEAIGNKGGSDICNVRAPTYLRTSLSHIWTTMSCISPLHAEIDTCIYIDLKCTCTFTQRVMYAHCTV